MQSSESPGEVWRSEPQEGTPPFVLSFEGRRQILKKVAELFSRWVIEGTTFEVSHDQDPYWDHSGVLIKLQSTPQGRLELYPTLERWAEDAPTGGSVPTFLSGCGLRHQTFEEEVEQTISSELAALWTKNMSSTERERFLDKAFEDASTDIEMRLVEQAYRIPTCDAWILGETGARESIKCDEERRERGWARDQFHKARAGSFRESYLADLSPNYRIDGSNSRAFMERLSRILDLVDTADLDALASMGLPGNFSNSVKDRIARMAIEKKRQRPEGQV